MRAPGGDGDVLRFAYHYPALDGLHGVDTVANSPNTPDYAAWSLTLIGHTRADCVVNFWHDNDKQHRIDISSLDPSYWI